MMRFAAIAAVAATLLQKAYCGGIENQLKGQAVGLKPAVLREKRGELPNCVSGASGKLQAQRLRHLLAADEAGLVPT
jgi:hypothetical protein